MECTHIITTLYSISMIKTLIIQHFEIFVGSGSKLNLMRKRNLDDVDKNNRKLSKFHLKFLSSGWKREIPQIPSKKTEIQ